HAACAASLLKFRHPPHAVTNCAVVARGTPPHAPAHHRAGTGCILRVNRRERNWSSKNAD
ncbi:MAG: hypothetical protein ACRD3W_03645, partial [Terriglobales bacterium]